MRARVLPKPIRKCLRRHVRRRRQAEFLRAWGQAAAFAGAWSLGACAADRWLQLPLQIRALLLATGLCVVVARVLRPTLRLMLGRIDWMAAARSLDETNPALAERMQTVVTQRNDPALQQGSVQLLEALETQLAGQLRQQPPRGGGGWRGVGWAWLLALCLSGAWVALLAVHAGPMRALAMRLVRPTADLEPVTTTHLRIWPGDTPVEQGASLQIRVEADRLSGGVELFTSPDGATWSSIPLPPSPRGGYSTTLPAIDGPLWYYAVGGDARTAVHHVHVLRRPAITLLQARVRYPAASDALPVDSLRAGGAIESPVGGELLVHIEATEPLRSATLRIGKLPGARAIPMRPTASAASFEAATIVTRDEPLAIELVSAGGISGNGPAGLSLRATPDRPPLVRILQPSDDLLLGRSGQVEVQVQALDDYGIAKLWAAAAVNNGPAQRINLLIQGDARRQESSVLVDLAALAPRVGDLVSLQITAEDLAGQRMQTEPRQILVCAHSPGASASALAGELRRCAQLARALAEHTTAARDALARLMHPAGQRSDGADFMLNANRSLLSAGEAAALLHQGLLRAIRRAEGPNEAVALINCLDTARILDSRCAAVNSSLMQDGSPEGASSRLDDVAVLADSLAIRTKTLFEGRQADLLRLERRMFEENLATAGLPERLASLLERTRGESNARTEELGIDSSSPEADADLQRRAADMARWLSEQQPIDYVTPARQWADALDGGDTRGTELAERLVSGAAAEALRRDGDPRWARDLQMAANAAFSLARPPANNEPTAQRQRRQNCAQFPATLATLQREHLSRISTASLPSADSESAAGRAARQRLLGWSGDAGSPDDLALEANAAMLRRDYERAAQLDEQMARQTPAGPALRQLVEKARLIEQAAAAQRQAREQLNPSTTAPSTLGERQSALAESLQRIRRQSPAGERILQPSPESRTAATAALQQAQEELAALPKQLARVQEAAGAYVRARERSRLAEQEAAASADAESLDWAVAQAQRMMRVCETNLDAAAEALQPSRALGTMQRLRQAGSDAADSLEYLAGPLQQALQQTLVAVKARDLYTTDSAAAELRSRIQAAQQILRADQDRLIKRDPLAVAQWFARAAAASLARQPARPQQASAHQKSAADAIEEAWAQTLHDAAMQRLGAVPSLADVFGRAAQPQENAGASLGIRRAAARPAPAPTPQGPQRSADPPGFSDALRAYFEELGKASRSTERK